MGNRHLAIDIYKFVIVFHFYFIVDNFPAGISIPAFLFQLFSQTPSFFKMILI